MAETSIWEQSWVIFSLSTCILFTITISLLCCICWGRKKKEVRQFYVLDENGLKTATISEVTNNTASAGLNLFRRLSNGLTGKEFCNHQAVFTSANLPIIIRTEKSGELLESNEIVKSFDKSILKISESRDNSDYEETHSCISADSKTTFYSMYPGPPRRMSKASTFVSVDFEEEGLLK